MGHEDDENEIQVEVNDDVDDDLSWDSSQTEKGHKGQIDFEKVAHGDARPPVGASLKDGILSYLHSLVAHAKTSTSSPNGYAPLEEFGLFTNRWRGHLPRQYLRLNFCIPLVFLLLIALFAIPKLTGPLRHWRGRQWLLGEDQGVLQRLVHVDGSLQSLKTFPAGRVDTWAQIMGTEQESTIACQGSGRERYCIVNHGFCVGAGSPFVVREKAGPLQELAHGINMVPGDGGESDRLMTLRAISRDDAQSMKIQYLDTDLVVYGHYAPSIPTHYLYNGVIPAWSALAENTNQTERAPNDRDFWLYRYATYQKGSKRDLPTSLNYLTTGRELVNDPDELSATGFELLAPKVPICFSRAILGSGSRTPFRYSTKQIPHQHIVSFEKAAKDFFLTTFPAEKIRSPDRCTILSESHTHTASSVSEKEAMVVGLVRTTEKRILNLDQIARLLRSNRLVKAVKVIDVTEGCSMPSMIKLLEDVQILIGSPSDVLSEALFMPQSISSTIISVEARDFYVDMHNAIHVATGRRVANLVCQSTKCGYLDYEAAEEAFKRHGLVVEPEILKRFLSAGDMSSRKIMLNLHQQRFGQGLLVSAEEVYMTYANMAGRRLEVARIIPMIEKSVREGAELLTRESTNGYTYPQLASDGKACGPSCHWIMRRAIFSPHGVYGEQWAHGEPRDWHPDE